MDYLRLVEQALGVRFEVTARAALPTLLEMARRGEVDLLASLTRTPDREAYLRFTRPYFSSPLVLLVRNERNGPDRLEEMAGARIAVWRDSAAEEFLRRNFPRVERVPVANDDATVLLVLSGSVDGGVADLASVSWILTSTGVHGLRVASGSGSPTTTHSPPVPTPRSWPASWTMRSARCLPRRRGASATASCPSTSARRRSTPTAGTGWHSRPSPRSSCRSFSSA